MERDSSPMDEYKIIFYETPNGDIPAKDFIDSLDDKMGAKMVQTLAFLQKNGVQSRMPYSEHLDDGIFEARAKAGSKISRVLYFFFVGKQIVLTNGFIKKTQKTPPRELEQAKKYRKEFLSRKENTQ